jgi:hypothetical protein
VKSAPLLPVEISEVPQEPIVLFARPQCSLYTTATFNGRTIQLLAWIRNLLSALVYFAVMFRLHKISPESSELFFSLKQPKKTEMLQILKIYSRLLKIWLNSYECGHKAHNKFWEKTYMINFSKNWPEDDIKYRNPGLYNKLFTKFAGVRRIFVEIHDEIIKHTRFKRLSTEICAKNKECQSISSFTGVYRVILFLPSWKNAT